MALMDLMPAGIRLVNRAGECEYTNQAFITMFGYQMPEIRLNDDWFNRAYPDPHYRQEIVSWYSEKIPALVRGLTPPPLQAAITCKDGSVKQVLISAHIAVGRVIGIYTDISEQMKTVELQLEIEKMFRLTFEGSRDAIVWVNAASGILVNCNRAAEELLEKPRNEIIGNHFTCLHPPDIHEQIRAQFTKVTIIPQSLQDLESEVLSRSGRRIPVLIRHSVTNISGTEVVQGVFLDISERKKVEKALMDSCTLLQKTLSSLNETVFIVETGSRIILDCNDSVEKMFGYTRTEIIGQNTACLHISAEMSRTFGTEMLKSYEEQGYFETEFIMRRKDGTSFYSGHCVTPIRAADKTIVNHVCVVRDITQQRQAEQYRVALEAERIALEEQREFMGLLSHELRTPLSIIDGAAQLILLTTPLESSSFSQAERIRSAASRLCELIDGCLNEDRLSTSGWQLDLQDQDIAQLVQSAVEQSRVRTQGHTIELVMSSSPLPCSCDATLIKILLSNLLDNAIKYSPDGGQITLHVSRLATGTINFAVTDQGIGIPADQLDAIFKRFHRTWQIQGVTGAGLGLSLVKRIADIHGGNVACKSILGSGSTFTISLPSHR